MRHAPNTVSAKNYILNFARTKSKTKTQPNLIDLTRLKDKYVFNIYYIVVLPAAKV